MLLAIGVISGLVLLGLVGANFLHDRAVTSLITRRLAAGLGGLAYLASGLGLDAAAAVGLSAALTAGMVFVRFFRPFKLRGVMGTSPAADLDWITFPLAGTLALAVGWLWLGTPWLALTPILFMAWGDNIAGLVREVRARQAGDGASTVAMLGVCGVVAAVCPVYWIGAVGALVATAAERFRPTTHRLWDDNLLIVGASLATMAMLAQFDVS